MAVATGSRTVGNRWYVFSHAVAFVLGFSLVFVTLGASIAFLGYAINQYLPLFVKIGGVVLIIFGLYIAGAFGWLADRIRAAGGDRNTLGRGYVAFVDGLGRLMYTEGRVQKQVDRRWGYLSSFLMGVFFSAGWIPCVGPVLAAIYLLASDTATVAQGALLLLAYSAGLGIPFLLTGLALNEMTGVLRRMNRHAGPCLEDHGHLPDPDRHPAVQRPAHPHRQLRRRARRDGAGERGFRRHRGSHDSHRVHRRAAFVPLTLRAPHHPRLHRLPGRDGRGERRDWGCGRRRYPRAVRCHRGTGERLGTRWT